MTERIISVEHHPRQEGKLSKLPGPEWWKYFHAALPSAKALLKRRLGAKEITEAAASFPFLPWQVPAMRILKSQLPEDSSVNAGSIVGHSSGDQRPE